MRRGLSILALLALASAEDDTPQQAAARVLEAFRTQDGTALAKLAARDDPDPWLVADELAFRGEHDAAAAFARAAPRKDVDKLAAYVASRRSAPPNVAARKAIAASKEAFAARNWKAALDAFEAVDADAGDVVSVRALQGRGRALSLLRRPDEAAAAFLAAADAAERLGWLARAANTLYWTARAQRGSEARGALAALERLLALEQLRGNRAGVAAALINLGNIHQALGSHATALEYYERGLKLAETIGHQQWIANALANIGRTHFVGGSYTKALKYFERSLEPMENLGNPASVAEVLHFIGSTHLRLGSYAKALDCAERALTLYEGLGHRAGTAALLTILGNIHSRLSSYAKALDYQARALKLAEQLGNRAEVANTLGNIGAIHGKLGSYAKALECLERSLALNEAMGNRAGAANALTNIGNIHTSLGSYAKALDYLERALKLVKEQENRGGVALTLASIGVIHERLGSYAKALEYQERALAISEALGTRYFAAATLGNIGATHRTLGSHEKALEYYERALKLNEELGARAGAALTLGNIGNTYHSLGDYVNALAHLEQARALAAELGSTKTEVWTLGWLAATQLALAQPAEAAGSARRAVQTLPLLIRGLADEQGALARGRWAWLMEHGVLAAVQLEDAAEVSFFLESNRAGALLESLGGREALAAALIPAELRDEETAARAAALDARARLGRAIEAKRRKEIRAARTELDAAHRRVLDAVARIQRAAKAAADVAYPRAAALDKIQASLAEGDALVSFVLLPERAVALVVTAEDARVVPLGESRKIVTVCEQVQFGVARGARVTTREPRATADDLPRTLATLRNLVVEPLGLGKKVSRVLISPHGTLSYVPFALLVDREVVMVPSGTTYEVLLDARARTGAAVLGLGDPDYGAKRDERAGAVVRSGASLSPLPETRAEVKAVADEAMLGRDASEAGFRRSVAARKRWRAVHFACHGLIRADQPQLSSLALTPDPDNDGFFTVLEVFRMRIPADLVVLSACETAKGKVYHAEGIVGFTRAFMMAGAPRVIVSLWKVDDEATRALMVKFYELWQKHPTATALTKAQEFVASHEKWKHPYYWAAWQLWGLPH